MNDEALMNLNLNLSRFKRTTQEERIHDVFTSTCLRNIFKQSEHPHEIIVSCQKIRNGNVIEKFAAAYVLSVPNCTINIFSLSRIESETINFWILYYLEYLFKTKFIERNNGENIYLRLCSNDSREINTYPLTIETLRGVGGGVIIVENIDHSQDYFTQVIVPLRCWSETVVLGMTSDSLNRDYGVEVIEI